KNWRVAISAQKTDREGQPLPRWDSSHHVEQKNKQVIGMPFASRQRFLMSDLEINQPRSFRFLVVDHVSHRGITVRPGTAEFPAFEMMRAPIFIARCF